MGKIGKTKTKSKPNQPEQQLSVGPRDLRSARRNLSFALVACAGAFILDLVACFVSPFQKSLSCLLAPEMAPQMGPLSRLTESPKPCADRKVLFQQGNHSR